MLNTIVSGTYQVMQSRSSSVAWVFPGQGSQFVGMGCDLYAHDRTARQVFEQAEAALDLNLARLCFEGPETELTATENAQPALLTMSVAALRMLDALAHEEQAFLCPAIVAGHSLGEYAALVAAGALDFVTAVRLVRRRGELMAAAREGTMAAIIGLDELILDQVCRDVSILFRQETHVDHAVVIANYNAPGQFVISGVPAAVKHACSMAKERGAKRALPLKVSAAFHSPLMSDAAHEMAAAVNQATVMDVHTPLVANVTAETVMAAEDIRHELISQIVEPVRWIASIRYMLAQGISTFVEIGAGNVLTGLIKRIAPDAQTVNLSRVDDIRAFALATVEKG